MKRQSFAEIIGREAIIKCSLKTAGRWHNIIGGGTKRYQMLEYRRVRRLQALRTRHWELATPTTFK